MLIKHESFSPLNCEETEGNIYIWFENNIHVFDSLATWEDEFDNGLPVQGYAIDTRFSPYKGRIPKYTEESDKWDMYYGTILEDVAWVNLGDVPEFPVEFKTQMMLLGIT